MLEEEKKKNQEIEKQNESVCNRTYTLLQRNVEEGHDYNNNKKRKIRKVEEKKNKMKERRESGENKEGGKERDSVRIYVDSEKEKREKEEKSDSKRRIRKKKR